MTWYIFRHCETLNNNLKAKYKKQNPNLYYNTAEYDTLLTIKGINQAQSIGYRLSLLNDDFSKYDLSALVKADVAGEALNPALYEHFMETTGVKMREGFGQTETCIMLFNNPWIEPKPGSMGMPAAGWDVQLLDERGRVVPDGTVGEICVNVKNIYSKLYKTKPKQATNCIIL